MWIMTPFGFMSVVTRPTDDRKNDHWKNCELQVRARDRRTLEILRRYMGTDISPIEATPNRDYQFRAYCEKADFALALTALVSSIDYPNFKDATLRRGMGGRDLHNLYGRIWGVVLDFYAKKRKS